MSDEVQGKDAFNCAFTEIYTHAGRPAARDVMALYDSGEIPPEKPELHILKGFIDFYRESVARAWFEEALASDVNRFPHGFLKLKFNTEIPSEVLPVFAAFLDAYLGSGHGVKVSTLEDDPKSIIFVSDRPNKREIFTKIAAGMSQSVWMKDSEVKRKMNFFLSQDTPGAQDVLKWDLFVALMNELGRKPPEA